MLNEMCYKAYNYGGQIFMKRQENQSALMFFEKSIQIKEDQSDVLANIASIYRILGVY